MPRAKKSPPAPAPPVDARPNIAASGRGRRHLIVLVAVLALGGGAVLLLAQSRRPAVAGIRVVESYPHDPRAFSQGLAFHDGQLYEGTGQTGQSALRRVELKTGRVLQQHRLDRRLFGEGVTILDGKIYQLTWKAGVCFVYDLKTFREVGRFRYPGEGWGLTHNGRQLILSDGSSTLRFIDPTTFRVVRRVYVKHQRRALTDLNELEYVDGEILANVWRKDYIARINPETGVVVGWIDLRSLYPPSRRASVEHVLNGIAYDADGKRLLVTGKNWPRLYHIELTP